jgi:hypothetical protein
MNVSIIFLVMAKLNVAVPVRAYWYKTDAEAFCEENAGHYIVEAINLYKGGLE